jgi:hypothetical protein
METYTDVREADSVALHARWISETPTPADKALAVFLLNPTVRAVLDVLDPKGVEQARNALRLT